MIEQRAQAPAAEPDGTTRPDPVGGDREIERGRRDGRVAIVEVAELVAEDRPEDRQAEAIEERVEVGLGGRVRCDPGAGPAERIAGACVVRSRTGWATISRIRARRPPRRSTSLPPTAIPRPGMRRRWRRCCSSQDSASRMSRRIVGRETPEPLLERLGADGIR